MSSSLSRKFAWGHFALSTCLFSVPTHGIGYRHSMSCRGEWLKGSSTHALHLQPYLTKVQRCHGSSTSKLQSLNFVPIVWHNLTSKVTGLVEASISKQESNQVRKTLFFLCSHMIIPQYNVSLHHRTSQRSTHLLSLPSFHLKSFHTMAFIIPSTTLGSSTSTPNTIFPSFPTSGSHPFNPQVTILTHPARTPQHLPPIRI